MSLFTPSIITAAQAAERAYYPKGPFVSITLAQWALESDYGRDVSGDFNYFGIKATKAQIAAKQATLRWTHETQNGVYKKVPQWFANYPNETACFTAHSELLCNPEMAWAYGECWVAKTPEEYAAALQLHYATGEPDHPYGATLMLIINQNKLTQYDIVH